jgi:hypothetical protein
MTTNSRNPCRSPDLLRRADDRPDEDISDPLVDHLKAALAPDLVVEPADDRLVLHH